MEESDPTKNHEPIKPNPVKHLTRSIFYAFISSYGMIPLGMIMTWLFSRIILEDYWNNLIWALSIVGYTQIIFIFIPPDLYTALLYKTAEHAALNQYGKIKGMVNYAVIVKGILGLIGTIVFLVLGLILYQNTNPIISNEGYQLMILSPMSLLNEMNCVFSNILAGLRYFGSHTFIAVLSKLLFFAGYLYCFFWNTSSIAHLNLILILNVGVTFVLAIGQYFIYFRAFHKIQTISMKWQEFKSYSLFGTYYALAGSANNVYNLVVTQLLQNYGGTGAQIYFNIPTNMLNQTLIIAQLPIGSVFTELEKKGQRDEMVRLFTRSSFAFSVIISFLIGLLFFAIKFFVLIVYPLNYIAAIDQVRLYILAVYFIFITSNYHGLFSITNNQKRVTLIETISAGLSILITFILSIYFNFLGIVLGNVVGNAIYAVLYWAYGKYRLKEFKIPFLQMFQHAIALMVILALIVWISPFIANYAPITNFSSYILQFVSKIVHFDVNIRYPGILEGVVNLVLFIILFYLYMVFSRSITKEDINAIQQSGIKIPFAKYLKKLVLSRKNNDKLVEIADQKI